MNNDINRELSNINLKLDNLSFAIDIAINRKIIKNNEKIIRKVIETILEKTNNKLLAIRVYIELTDSGIKESRLFVANLI